MHDYIAFRSFLFLFFSFLIFFFWFAMLQLEYWPAHDPHTDMLDPTCIFVARTTPNLVTTTSLISFIQSTINKNSYVY